MVTAKTQYSLTDARKYFEKHLAVGDYYEEGQTVMGRWFGEGAMRLALDGRVGRNEFLALCENRNPSNGETLTQRQRMSGSSNRSSDRRVFYDFTFSPPKSVSIAGLVACDQNVIQAHHRALRVALEEFEAFASTRVRKGTNNQDRVTSNVVAALFTHDTSRALDPHLHTHCIVFNATFDPVETRWKALQNHDLLRARRFAENVYYHELAKDLGRLGYQMRNHPRGDFEIQGISPELCRRFSKRHEQIERELERLLSEKPELATGNLKEIKEHLAEARRARKIENITQEDLQRLWRGQLTEGEWMGLGQTRNPHGLAEQAKPSPPLDEAVTWAEEHLFDRHSVVLECNLWQEALSRARGQDFSVAELKEFTRERGYIRDPSRPLEVTLREVLLREWEIVQVVREGAGNSHPLVRESSGTHPALDEEQRRALERLLASTNTVALFRGGAGTGKSFVLRELAAQVQENGRPVVVLAPQRQQVVDMEAAGFPSPTSVTAFLQKRDVPSGAVIVVDEAGQIGGRQMLDLLRLAHQRHARVVLSGDTRQHGPVEASDALMAIERHSGVAPVELHTIRRQDPALGRDDDERRSISRYRKAVEAAAAGRLADSFERLDKMGAVVACGLTDQADRLADEYLRLVQEQGSAVVVSQTWTEVQRVNSRVRDALKAKGLLGANDSAVETLERLDLTNAQKRDERFYPPEAVVIFNQKVRHADAGARGKLAGIVSAGVLVEVDGKFITVQNRLLGRINVCVPRDLALAAGDRIHLKANRKLASGNRVANGELATVKAVRPDGAVELEDGRVLDASYREFSPGYAVTSYGSQGKTVDYVLFSDSTIKAATNAQQWYVTISRGRRGIRIFTPDKEQLRENVSRSGHRPLALDLAPGLVFQPPRRLWDTLRRHLLRFGRQAADRLSRVKPLRRRWNSTTPHHEHHQTT